MKSSKLNIYKLKQEITSFEEIVLDGKDPPFDLESEVAQGNFQYKLFVQRNKPGSPEWASLMRPLLRKDVRNSNSSFLLLIKVEAYESFPDSFLALTGGHTAHGLIHRYVEVGFGLKIAERTVNPRRIRNLTQTSFTGSDRQVVRAVNRYNPTYDVENQRRILKALDGKPLNEELVGLSVSGSDSLKIRKEITFEELRDYLKEIMTIYHSGEETVRWPRNFVPIKDFRIIEQLTNQLIENFRRLYRREGYDEFSDSFFVGYKDFFDFLKCSSFVISFADYEQEIGELDLDAILSFLRSHDVILNSVVLRTVNITGFDEDGYEVIPSAELTEFLYTEINYRDETYFFIDKEWFLVHGSYKDYVDHALSNIPILPNNYLPAYDSNLFNREEDYLAWVPQQDQNFFCLDQDFVTNRIEICDLFKIDAKHFVHVKKGWGAKLSHLFAQASVSAALFHSDQNFRREANQKCGHIGLAKINNEYSVIFAIVDSKANRANFPNNMTYFSKVNLLDNTERIMQSGYNVKLVPVRYT